MKKRLQLIATFRQAFWSMFLQCLFCNVLLADGGHAGNKSIDEVFINVYVRNAPPLEVSGTVTDQNGMSLPGVNIIEKGTNNGTITDVDGKYTIIVSDESAVLIFSSIAIYQLKLLLADNPP